MHSVLTDLEIYGELVIQILGVAEDPLDTSTVGLPVEYHSQTCSEVSMLNVSSSTTPRLASQTHPQTNLKQTQPRSPTISLSKTREYLLCIFAMTSVMFSPRIVSLVKASTLQHRLNGPRETPPCFNPLKFIRIVKLRKGMFQSPPKFLLIPPPRLLIDS